jgi:hypothetical protein
MPIPSEEGAAIVFRSGQVNWERESVKRARKQARTFDFGLVWPAVAATLYNLFQFQSSQMSTVITTSARFPHLPKVCALRGTKQCDIRTEYSRFSTFWGAL